MINEFNESPFEELFGTTAASFPDLLDLGTTAEIDIDGFLNMDTTEVPEFLFTTPDTEIMFSTAGLLLPEETTPFVSHCGSFINISCKIFTKNVIEKFKLFDRKYRSTIQHTIKILQKRQAK